MPDRKYAVLVVDDDAVVLETTVAVLSDHFAAVGVRSPAAGLKMLLARTYHVVVADWMMPGMDGLSFFREVEKLPIAVGCLLMTGHMDVLVEEIDREDRRKLGLIAKPFAPPQIIARVEHLARIADMKRTLRDLKAGNG